MATTPKGYPYPVGTDRVMDGDDAIAALATAVDQKVGVVACGQVASGNPTALNTPVSVAVTFPVGRFTAIPQVTGSPLTSAVAVCYPVGVSSITTTGCVLSWARSSGGLTGINMSWQAIQNP